MQSSTKLWASVAGVGVTTAVVVGAVLGATGGDPSPSVQRPAGNVGGAAPATVTATVTASASPTATVAAKVSPSTKTAATPNKRQAVVRQQQEAPVTDPAPPADSQPPAQQAPQSDPPASMDNPVAPAAKPNRQGGNPHPSSTADN